MSNGHGEPLEGAVMAKFFLIALIVSVGMLAVLIEPSPRAAGAIAPAKIKPLMTLAGSASGVKRQAYHRVTADEQWAKLWKAHQGQDNWDPVPQVDFERCTLVAIFEGATSNVEPMELDSITETADAV